MVEQKYAEVGKRKVAYWYRKSANSQLHLRLHSKSVVKPVTSQPVAFLAPAVQPHGSPRQVWCFNCIDLFSRYLWVVPMQNKEGVTCARAMRTIV